MSTRSKVRLTAHFERNLQQIQVFWEQAQAAQAFDALIDELLGTVIPNLERFPALGRRFLDRPLRSVEAASGVARLRKQLAALDPSGQLREYVTAHYLVLYAQIRGVVVLLSIRHQRQLSFDFSALWGESIFEALEIKTSEQ